MACDHLFEQLRSWLSVRLYRQLFPASDGSVPHAQPLALPEVFLPEGVREDLAFEFRQCGATPFLSSGCPFPRLYRLERRTESDCRSKGSFCPRLPEESGASLEGGERKDRCSLRKPSMAFLASRSRGCCPLKQRGPKRGTIQQTRAVRRTPRLQRTLEAFSRVVACGRWWLRGQPAACNGRTLRRQPLGAVHGRFEAVGPQTGIKKE